MNKKTIVIGVAAIAVAICVYAAGEDCALDGNSPCHVGETVTTGLPPAFCSYTTTDGQSYDNCTFVHSGGKECQNSETPFCCTYNGSLTYCDTGHIIEFPDGGACNPELPNGGPDWMQPTKASGDNC